MGDHGGGRPFQRWTAPDLSSARVLARPSSGATAGKWVGERDEVGRRPDRNEMSRPASSREMTKTPFDNEAERDSVSNAVASDSALFLGTLTLGLAMLALLGVLALGGVLGGARVLPFFALPPALFVASGVLLWRWMSGESEEVAVREVDRSRYTGHGNEHNDAIVVAEVVCRGRGSR